VGAIMTIKGMLLKLREKYPGVYVSIGMTADLHRGSTVPEITWMLYFDGKSMDFKTYHTLEQYVKDQLAETIEERFNALMRGL
jgi:hypothetical protein